MFGTLHRAKPVEPPGSAGRRILRRALRDLYPDRAWRHPALFLLESIGALLVILALRDAMIGVYLAHIEAAGAAALWIALLFVKFAGAVATEAKETDRSGGDAALGRTGVGWPAS
jgi:high-affinity K+ transport system ATPase subunit B